jgi:hypothetical protein
VVIDKLLDNLENCTVRPLCCRGGYGHLFLDLPEALGAALTKASAYAPMGFAGAADQRITDHPYVRLHCPL